MPSAMTSSDFSFQRGCFNIEVMIEIAQALLFDRDGKLLIYLRDDKPTIPFPNHWDLFGGHVEVGRRRNRRYAGNCKKRSALTSILVGCSAVMNVCPAMLSQY